jgi:hypothetical protein
VDTLKTVIDHFEADGYRGQFVPTDGARLRCLTCRVVSPASAIPLLALSRLEGTSDPGDEVAVAALVCPNCGTRGTFVAHFGPEASLEEADAFAALADERGPNRSTDPH